MLFQRKGHSGLHEWGHLLEQARNRNKDTARVYKTVINQKHSKYAFA